MYPVSELFKTYVAQSDRQMEVKAVIGLTTYDNTKVVEFAIEDSLIASDEFTIGTVIPSKLTLLLKTTDAIATNAKITPYVRLNGASGYTEWIPLGSFYIDNRTYKDGIWTFTCYDKLITTQQKYVSTLTYPETMANVFNEMVTQLGFTVDPSVVINQAYMIPYEDLDISMRDMFSYISSAHGCSIRLTKDEKLTFVPFIPTATKTPLNTIHYFKCEQTNPLKTYTRILLTYNTDGETLEAGTGDEDHTMNLYNPFMTEDMLNTVLAGFTGFSYMPITMDWKGFVYVEVGDAVQITLRDTSVITSTLLTNKATFKGGLKATSTAPSISSQKSEFSFQGTLSEQIKNAVKIDQPYYGVTIGRANGIKVTKSDGSGELILNADTIDMKGAGAESVFKLDSAGKLIIKAMVQMLAGSIITWGNLPTDVASQQYVLDNAGGITEEDFTVLANTWISTRKVKLSELTSIDEENPIIYQFTKEGRTVSGGYNTITLDANASSTDDVYKNKTIKIISGTGSGQRRVISGYVGSTKIATVNVAWDTPPDHSSTYMIYGASIDMTDNNEEGVGNEFRLKLNMERYILQDADSVVVYFPENDGSNRPTITKNGFQIGNLPIVGTLQGVNFFNNGFSAAFTNGGITYTWTKDGAGKITKLTNVETSEIVDVTWNAGDL